MAKTPPKTRKCPLGIDVLVAARERIAWVFDSFDRVYLSGPSGKDSSVMMHLVCQEARRRGRKVGVLYVDLEAQYALTIDHVREMFALYADCIDPFWVALPIHLRNAVSQVAPFWVCWDPAAEPLWVRPREPGSIADASRFLFYRDSMEFEEFELAAPPRRGLLVHMTPEQIGEPRIARDILHLRARDLGAPAFVRRPRSSAEIWAPGGHALRPHLAAQLRAAGEMPDRSPHARVAQRVPRTRRQVVAVGHARGESSEVEPERHRASVPERGDIPCRSRTYVYLSKFDN